MENTTDFFAQKKSLKDIFNFKICYRYDQFVNNVESNRAYNLKMAFFFALIWFWNYSLYYSLNCTRLSRITISYDDKKVVVIEY